MKKSKIKLNKRAIILTVITLFSISFVTTFLIVGAIKRGKEPKQPVVTEISPSPVENITPTPAEEITPEPTAAPSPTHAATAQPFVYPKEGVRPIAVMIDNEGNKVLPQGGIGQAQVVYEVLTEYGATRYMALFWENLPKMIGPVRSSRHYFLDYVMEYDAIYTHIGWSDYAYRDLALYPIDNIDGVSGKADGVFWDLTKDRSNYQDSYTNPERLNNFLSKSQFTMEAKQPLPLSYHSKDTDLTGGNTAKDVFIRYSRITNAGFYYDAAQKNYKRTRMGEFHIDRNTNETIRAKNIIILHVKNETIAGDKYGRQEVYTTGSGKGYYITNGLAQEITWKKDSRDAQTQYLTTKGEKIILNPGQTWIQIVPIDATVTIE